MSPILSVIIVAYKSRDEIGACLASLPRLVALSNGVEGAVEVIVVDNSPGDGAGLIVREQFPWVNYVDTGGNLGFGRANNRGFALAKGECILFLNPDTVCSERALRHCLDRLFAEDGIGLISPQLVTANGAMDLACRRSIPTFWDGFCRASGLSAAFPRVAAVAAYNLTHLPENGTYAVGAINGAFMMGRRSVFAAVAAATAGVQPRLQPEDLKVKIKDGHSAGSVRRWAKPNPLAKAAGNIEPIGNSLQPTADPLSPRAAMPSVAVFDENFFMYGDDLDLCIRVARAGLKIVYDGSVSITHLKGVSVAKDYDGMASAIFDANRDVYLKHFNPRGSSLVRWKYKTAFGAWKQIALWRAKLRGHRAVRPV